jgi:zinc transport system substrate-binding protein
MKQLKRILLACLLVFFIAGIAGCNTGEADESVAAGDNGASEDKLIVAVSIVPEQTYVEAVCGDLAEVITMVPPGNSPGNYEPTAEQMEAVSDASLYFTIGIPTETANILPDIPDVEVISLGEAVAAVYPDRTFASGGRDPHIWLSPKRAEVMVDTIAEAMIALDPDNEETYRENADAYIAELQEADQEIAALFEDVENKDFIIYHPAYGYFADDYGLTMHSLQVDGNDATAQQLQDMIDLANEKSIKVIYIQAEFDSSQAEEYAEEIGGEVLQLSPLSADYIGELVNAAKMMAENM